jgi:hypothetical protein
MSTPRKSADASFAMGLVLGLLVGAGVVIVLSPQFHTQANRVARELGLSTGADGRVMAERGRDTLLKEVAPPPDPLSATAET